MAHEVCVTVSTEDRARLAAIIDDRNCPLKHIQRPNHPIFGGPLAGAAGSATRRREPPGGVALANTLCRSRSGWALRDKTRPPGRTPVPTATVTQVLALTKSEPSGEATHWTGRAMAK